MTIFRFNLVIASRDAIQAKQSRAVGATLDCRVAQMTFGLLAMTGQV